MRWRLALGLGIWLAAGAGFTWYLAASTHHIGRMELPTDQAAAIAASVFLATSLFVAWIWAVVRWLLRRFGLGGAPSFVELRPVRRVLLAALLLAVPTLLYARLVEPRWVAVREVELGGTPADAQASVRLVVLSDLHVEGDREPWTGLAGRVNALEPDLIVFLGDTLNRRSALPVLQRVLGAMQAPQGKFAVQGNWEAWYWGGLPLLAGTGFQWLDRTPRRLEVRGQRLHLVGFRYRDIEQGAAAEQVLAALPTDDWRIFLYHTPDLAEEVPSADLYLAGHTHGGQLTIPFYGPPVTLSKFGRRFGRGLNRAGQTLVYTNPGIGVEPMVQMRLGVRPEITLLLLGARRRGRT